VSKQRDIQRAQFAELLAGDALVAAVKAWLDGCGSEGDKRMPPELECAIYSDRELFAAFSAGRQTSVMNIAKALRGVSERQAIELAKDACSLRELLTDIWDRLDEASDVNDGADGPTPNSAMSIMQEFEARMDKAVAK
jgi:hypothetical protein